MQEKRNAKRRMWKLFAVMLAAVSVLGLTLCFTGTEKVCALVIESEPIAPAPEKIMLPWIQYSETEDEKILTFYYNDQYTESEGNYYISNSEVPEINNKSDITMVIFDESFKEYLPTKTERWFFEFSSLKNIEGLENLNTLQVTSMNDMFKSCSSLSNLDLSSFNTEFLVSMDYMFWGCSNLKKIYVSELFTIDKFATSNQMFEGCVNLVGGNGTAYNPEHIDSTYARIDSRTNPGYFSGLLRVSLWVNNDEYGTVSADCETYFPGEKVELTIEPKEGYQVKEILVCKSDNENEKVELSDDGTFIMPDFYVTVQVCFDKGYYLVTEAECEHGTVNLVYNTSEYSFGELVHVNAISDDGYMLKAYSVFKTDDETVSVDLSGDSFYMPAYPVTVYAEFEIIPVCTVTEAECEHGTVSVGEIKEYYADESVTVYAEPEEGYQVRRILVYVDQSDKAVTTMNRVPDNTSESIEFIPVSNDYAWAGRKTVIALAYSDSLSFEMPDCPVTVWADFVPCGEKSAWVKPSIEEEGYVLTYYYNDDWRNVPAGTFRFLDCFDEDYSYAPFLNSKYSEQARLFGPIKVLSGEENVSGIKVEPLLSNGQRNTSAAEGEKDSLVETATSNTAGVETAEASGEGLYPEEYEDFIEKYAWLDLIESSADVKAYAVKVIFDESFKDYHPTTTANWFAGYKGLKSIEGIEYLNTSKVTDMSRMFDGCSSLTGLDVTGFDTSNVTDMSNMFAGCSSLTVLDVTGFDTSNVTEMSSIFSSCSSLTGLDVTGFDTSNVKYMSSMFNDCSSLTVLDLTGFDTSKVEGMMMMFFDCSGLTTLNFGEGFSTENISSIESLFTGCSSLRTIYVPSDFTLNSSFYDDMAVFQGCTSLVGGNGTAYNEEIYLESFVDGCFAQIDKEGQPGYFTAIEIPEKTEEGQTTEEGGKTEEGQTTEEGGKTEEGQTTEEGGKTEEGQTTEEGGKTEEGQTTEEGGKTEEGQTTEEGGKTEEGQTTEKTENSDAGQTSGESENKENAWISGSTGSNQSTGNSGSTGSGQSTDNSGSTGSGQSTDNSGSTGSGQSTDNSGSTGSNQSTGNSGSTATDTQNPDVTGNDDSNTTAAKEDNKDDSVNDTPAQNQNVSAGKDNVSVKKGKTVIPDTITVDGVETPVTKLSADSFSNSKKVKKAELPASVTVLGRRAFKNCINLTEIVLNEGLKQINKSAFYGCSKLENVELGDSVTLVGAYAFKGCASMKTVNLGNNLKTLGKAAFSGCTSLEDVTIPGSVKKIGANVFYGCTSLKQITIETTQLTEDSIEVGAFRKIPKDMAIYVPSSVLDDYTELFRAKGLSKKIQIKAIAE